MSREPLSLGIVSDEIAADFAQAVEHGAAWGIRRYELRCLASGRVPLVSADELSLVRRLVERNSLAITALSPGIFKAPVNMADQLDRELTEVLPAALAMAKTLGTRLIIVFGFQQGPGALEEQRLRAAALLRRAAEAAAAEGCRVAIENEPGFLCDTGRRTGELIAAVDHPALGANWDPCNAFGTGETPYPDGYQAIRRFIFNVHVKDTLAGALIQCVPVGRGVIDWRGQLAALARDRIVDHVTIETHCLPLIENSQANVVTIRRMLEELSREARV